jgi:hypothetical protein
VALGRDGPMGDVLRHSVALVGQTHGPTLDANRELPELQPKLQASPESSYTQHFLSSVTSIALTTSRPNIHTLSLLSCVHHGGSILLLPHNLLAKVNS